MDVTMIKRATCGMAKMLKPIINKNETPEKSFQLMLSSHLA